MQHVAYTCADLRSLSVHERIQRTRRSFTCKFSPDLAPNNNLLQKSNKIGNALLHWQSVPTELYFYTFYTARSAAGILSCTWAHWWTTGLTGNNVMNIGKEHKGSAKTGPDRFGLLKKFNAQNCLVCLSLHHHSTWVLIPAAVHTSSPHKQSTQAVQESLVLQPSMPFWLQQKLLQG